MQTIIRKNLVKQVLDSLERQGTVWTSGLDAGRSPVIYDVGTRTYVKAGDRIAAKSLISVVNNANTHQYSSNVWISQADAKSLGIYFKRGTRGTPVIDNTGKKVFLFNVEQLNISQDHFLNSNIDIDKVDNINPAIEDVIKTCGFTFQNTNETPYYDAKNKVICMPDRSRFSDDDMYYTSVLHEIAHAIHEDIRGPVMERSTDPANYAKAELEAELTALSLAAANGLGFKCQENSLAFIKSWLDGYSVEEQTSMLDEVMNNVDENLEFLRERSLDQALKERDAYTLEKDGKVYVEVNSRQDLYQLSELGAMFDEHHLPYIVKGQDLSLFSKYLPKAEEKQQANTVIETEVFDQRNELEAKNAVNSNSPNVELETESVLVEAPTVSVGSPIVIENSGDEEAETIIGEPYSELETAQTDSIKEHSSQINENNLDESQGQAYTLDELSNNTNNSRGNTDSYSHQGGEHERDSTETDNQGADGSERVSNGSSGKAGSVPRQTVRDNDVTNSDVLRQRRTDSSATTFSSGNSTREDGGRSGSGRDRNKNDGQDDSSEKRLRRTTTDISSQKMSRFADGVSENGISGGAMLNNVPVGGRFDLSEEAESRGESTNRRGERDTKSIDGVAEPVPSGRRSGSVADAIQHDGGNLFDQAVESTERSAAVSESGVRGRTSGDSSRLYQQRPSVGSDTASSSNSVEDQQRSIHEVSRGADSNREFDRSGDARGGEAVTEERGALGESSSAVLGGEHAMGSEQDAQRRNASGISRSGRRNSDRDLRRVPGRSDEQGGVSVEEQDSGMASVLQHVENASRGIYVRGSHQSTRLDKTLLSGVPSDFVIKDNELGVGSEEVRFQNNINAIKTLKVLEKEMRWPTHEEQETLSKYVGWGGLANAFDERKEKWASKYQELKDLLDPKEYQSAKESIFNAFYTQPEIVANIHNILGAMNTNGQPLSVLEPSCGIGNFLGAMPPNLASSKTGVELDAISGRIASFLYPSADIVITDFKDFASAHKIDAVVGNVPFSSMVIDDNNYRGQMVVDDNGNSEKLKLNLHNYFITKSLDMTRAGGVIALITSSSTLDGNNEVVRRNLAQLGNFLGAIRLPNNAFKGAAGTDVVSDIIFLQKRDVRKFDVRDQDWIRTEQSDLDGDIFINSYFNQHPEMILGTQEVTTNQFGKKVLTVKPFENKTLSEAFKEASLGIVNSNNLSDSFIHPTEVEQEDGITFIPGILDSDIGTIKIYNGKAYEVISDVQAKELELSDAQKAKIPKFEELVRSYHKVIDLQLNDCSDEELVEAQKELKASYDNFTKGANSKKRVLINSPANAFLRADYRFNAMSALEDVDENKNLLSLADVFSKRTLGAKVVPVFEKPEDALYSSVLTTGGADFELMESLLNGKFTKAEIMEALGDKLFRDPKLVKEGDDDYTGWVDAENYLSGNIASKLEIAQAQAAKDSSYVRNVEALKAIMPPRIGLSDINFNMGSPFIDASIVQAFLRKKFGDGIKCSFGGGNWSVGVGRGYVSYQQKENREAITKLSEDYVVDLKFILQATLNLKAPKIYDEFPTPDGKGKKENERLTTMAVAKTVELEDEFKDYILSYENAKASNQIEQTYNDRYNSIVNRKFDGSKLLFGGMSSTVQLRPHQKDVVARTLFGGNTLMAHEVGAGKTFAMIASAMEGKRLGLHQKSCIAVPNAVHEQWKQDILKLYPQAKVLTLDLSEKGTTAKKRNTMMAKIANGDYDIVLVTHGQLGKMPLSLEAYQSFMDEQKARLEKVALGVDAATRKNIMSKISELEKRLKKRLDNKDRSGLNFEELGIDKLYIDEAHAFKNFSEATVHGDLAGITKSSSGRAIDLLAVTEYMNEKYGDKRVVLATGTPVSNNLTEFYTMMRYLSPSLLKEQKLDYIDGFISGFGYIRNGFEFDSVGEWQTKARLSMFNNVPEMMNMYQSTADVITVDTLGFKLPTAHTHVVACETTPEQDEALKSLRERAERVRTHLVDRTVDNMLKITNDGRNLALDQRLYDPSLGVGKGSKVEKVCDNVKRIYDADPNHKDTQMIFSDLGCPGNKKFSVYHAIKEELVARGIPENEIAFIQDYNTKSKKKQLMKAVNEGKVRVLLGSTNTVGTGVNCQERLKAVHHIDVPWRPADMTQRNGRIVRQGNTHSDVDVYQYVTKGTYDMVMYEKLMNKQKFVHQVMHYKDQKAHERTMQAVDDDEQLSFEEAMASSAKDRRVLDKATFDREYNLLTAERKSFLMRRTSAERKLKGLPAQIAEAEKVRDRWHEISQRAKAELIDTEKLKSSLEYFVKNMNRNTWSSTEELWLGECKGGVLKVYAYKDPSIDKWRVKFRFGYNKDDDFEINLRLGTKSDYWIKTLETDLDDLIDKHALSKAELVEELKADQERLTKTLEQPAIFKKEDKFQELAKLRDELDKTLSIPTEDFEELTSDYKSYMIWKLGSSNENSYIDMCMQESIEQGTAINKDWKPEDELKAHESVVDEATKQPDSAEKLYRLSKTEYMRTIETKPTSKEEVEEAKRDGFVLKGGKFTQQVPERIVEEARAMIAEKEARENENKANSTKKSAGSSSQASPKLAESKNAIQEDRSTGKVSNDVNVRYYPGKDFNISKLDKKFNNFMFFDHERKEWFCIASAKNMTPVEEFIKTLPHSAKRREALQNELNQKGLKVTIKRSAFEKSVRGAGKLLGFASKGAKTVGHVVKEISVNTVAKYLAKQKQKKAKVAKKLHHLPNPNAKIYLNVPYSQKEEAKALGARWDGKKWYATSQNIDKLSKWTKPEEPVMDTDLETMDDSIDAMIKDMRENGMIITREQLKFDGNGTAHGRCRCEGDHQGEKAGWYAIHLDGCPVLSMQNHRLGKVESKKYPNKESIARWKQNRQNATAMRKSANAQTVTQTWQQAATKEANFEQKQNSHDSERIAQVGNKVRTQIQTYHAYKADYPASQYLTKKGLDITQDAAAFMLRSGGQVYTCFAFSNANGEITTKQYVNAEGVKRFETGGQKYGSFHVINGFQQLEANSKAPLIIAEGVATAMSVQLAAEKGAVVVAAGDCGNLLNVAKALRAKYPDRDMVIAADNDHNRNDNVGLAHAQVAAKAVGATVVSPQFTKGERGTDFNDVMLTKGLPAVKSIICTHLEQNCKHKKSHSR